jgi:hypothetical protein
LLVEIAAENDPAITFLISKSLRISSLYGNQRLEYDLFYWKLLN